MRQNPFNSFEAIDLNQERHDRDLEDIARYEAEKDKCDICGADCAYEYHICNCGRVVCLECITCCNNCGQTICRKCAEEFGGLCFECSEKAKEKDSCDFGYTQSLFRLRKGLRFGFGC